MDQEVFVLSRIKEERGAAGLPAVEFRAFVSSGVAFIKLMLAFFMGATPIRATLLPAFMRPAGEVNWWAPRPPCRYRDRFGLHESARPARLPQPAFDRAT